MSPLSMLPSRTTQNNRSSLHANKIQQYSPAQLRATNHESVESISRPCAADRQRSDVGLASYQGI
jgi:hypothetical protein